MSETGNGGAGSGEEESLGALLETTLERIVAEHGGREVLERAEEGEWPRGLWSSLEENGLTVALAPEALGGSGLPWREGFAIFRAMGRARAPVPAPETLLATWLLARAGLPVPPGVCTVALGAGALSVRAAPGASGEEAAISGRLVGVPWGGRAGHVVVVLDPRGEEHGPRVLALPGGGGSGSVGVEPGRNMAGEPRDVLAYEDAPVLLAGTPGGPAAPLCAPGRGEGLLLALGSLARSAQSVGAAADVLERTVQYARDRVQFGRPLARFQAIQHYLADLAARLARAELACACAFRSLDRLDAGADWEDLELEVAAARVLADEAAASAVAIGHQVHGAIGFTREFELHFSTRRLLSWRLEFGGEAQWAARLGRSALARPGRALWEEITRRQASA